MTTTNYRSSSRNKFRRQETKRSRAAAKPSLERLEDRLALAGFGPADGSYILESLPFSYESVSVLSGDRIVAASSGNGMVGRYDGQGNLDTTFGSGGLAQTGIIGGGGVGDPLSVQADGKLVMAGGSSKLNTARLNANGSPDSTYGTGGVSASLDITTGSDVAYSSGIQSNGKIVVAGYTGSRATGASAVIARYTTSGAVDSGKGGFGQTIQGKPAGYTATSFGGTDNEFWGLAVQPDDKIVAVGYRQTYLTTTTSDIRLVIARYTASGTLDTTFNKTGYSIFLPSGMVGTKAHAVTLQADGKIDVSGYAVGADGDRDLLVARYNTNGTLDSGFGGGKGYVTFDIDGTVSQTDERATSLVIQPDGKIVAAGYVYPPTAQTPGMNVLVTRFNTDGTLDNTFGTGGFKMGSAPSGHTQWGYAVALKSDGSIIVGGRDRDQSAEPNAMLMRFYGASTPPAAPTRSSTTTTTIATSAATDALMAMFFLDDPTLSKRKNR